jgi:RimJ/RimL family protein N-acetyltransferase
MSSTNWPPDFSAENEFVRVEPLCIDHADDLRDAARDLGQLWYTPIPTPDGVEAEIERRLALREAGSMLPFAIVDKAGKAAGMTTYMNIDAANRHIEIGSTWYAPRLQRTGANTACKLLLLTHAFEKLDCIAVEFRTHRLNTQSRKAIEGLGAQLDGILRSHKIMPNGTVRDTAVYSITAAEWPAIKAHLEWQLEKPRG